MKKISVITINLNNAEGLKRTIESVVNQTYSNLEYLIIDGGSSDGSYDLIKKFEGHFAYWVIEKDLGIYNAMNKGVLNSNGEYLLFLNSGDELYNANTLESISKSLNKDIVYGNLIITNKNGEVGQAIYPAYLDFPFFVHLSLPHPGSFIKRKLFEIAGLYDEGLRICSDWKFFLDAVCKYKCSYKYLNIIIAAFKEDGLSSFLESTEIIKAERAYVLNLFYKEEYDTFLNRPKNTTEKKRMKMKLTNAFKRLNIFRD